jgi:hypothetical protein
VNNVCRLRNAHLIPKIGSRKTGETLPKHRTLIWSFRRHLTSFLACQASEHGVWERAAMGRVLRHESESRTKRPGAGCSQLAVALKTVTENAGDGGGAGVLTGSRKRAEPANAKPAEMGEDGGACATAAPVGCSDGTCCPPSTVCCGNGLCAADCTAQCPSDTPVDCLDGTCCPKKCCPNGGCDTCDEDAQASSSEDGGRVGSE